MARCCEEGPLASMAHPSWGEVFPFVAPASRAGGPKNGRLKENQTAKTRNAQPFVCKSLEGLPSCTLQAASFGEGRILY